MEERHISKHKRWSGGKRFNEGNRSKPQKFLFNLIKEDMVLMKLELDVV